MVITYLGQSFVRVQQGEMIIAFSPVAKEVEASVSRFGADLALLSDHSPLGGASDTVTYGNKIPFIVDGPGEYEWGGIFIQGTASVGAEAKVNTIYSLAVDGIRLCHLGLLTKAELTDEEIEELGSVDILFVPLNEAEALSPSAGAKLATSLEAKIIIPLAFGPKANDLLDKFLQTAGGGQVVGDKLSLKRKDLEGKVGEVMVIKTSK